MELPQRYVAFDLETTGLSLENPHPCTLKLSRRRYPHLPSHKLENMPDNKTTDENLSSSVNNASNSHEKIRLFMSLFKGRDYVYAKRWENKRKGSFGYAPVCLNLWKSEVCGKPKISCSKCAHKSYAELDAGVIESHLRGNIVVGIYPMLLDDTCFFLAMDFDKDDWQNDISVLRDVLSLRTALLNCLQKD